MFKEMMEELEEESDNEENLSNSKSSTSACGLQCCGYLDALTVVVMLLTILPRFTTTTLS